MRIGINALYLLPGKVGGTEIYVRNLVKWLAKVDNANEYFIFINRESASVFDETPMMKTVLCDVNATSRPKRILWEQFALPLKLKKLDIDLLLSAGMTAPFFRPATSILVIHDLQHINQPQNFSKSYLLFLKSIIYLSAKTADGIIAISRKVKQDIVRFYKIQPDRIAVIYHACDHNLFFPRSKDEIESARVKYNLPEHFILYVASLLPHKNHERLLHAFKIVRNKVGNIKLVLIGVKDKGHSMVSQKIKELGLQDDVIFLGWLPFEDIPFIYCASGIVVFPSLHEGFGIPILEAMACGVPVVSSNIEPLMEVAGDSALFIDPYDPADIANGILHILKDEEIRRKLIRNGFKRAKEFTWENTAVNTLSFLNSHIKN